MFLQIMLKYMFISISIILVSSFLENAFGASIRIIGGSEITIDKCSYQLSLMKSNKHVCGAIVINKSWALTTAACVKGAAIENISIRSSSNSHKTGGTVHQIIQIISHPSYNDAKKDYDIALIKVKTQFDSKTAKPITMATEGSIIKPGTEAIVTGWGVLTTDGVVFAEKLQQVKLPTLDQDVCKAANGQLITDRMFCGGYISGGRDICNGDFGGPMVYQDKLIGIASWSKSCGKPGGFSVFTSISKLRGWIKSSSGV